VAPASNAAAPPSALSSDRARVVDQYDLGQATYAIMLAAADLGLSPLPWCIECPT
jgi:hypothetical protein